MNILHNSRNIFVAGCGYQTPISHRVWWPGGRGELVPAISCCYRPVPVCEVTITGRSIPPPLTTSAVTATVTTGQHSASHHHLPITRFLCRLTHCPHCVLFWVLFCQYSVRFSYHPSLLVIITHPLPVYSYRDNHYNICHQIFF